MKKEVGDITILINNAGIVTGKKFIDSPDSLVEKTMQVNTMAHFWVIFVVACKLYVSGRDCWLHQYHSYFSCHHERI